MRMVDGSDEPAMHAEEEAGSEWATALQALLQFAQTMEDRTTVIP